MRVCVFSSCVGPGAVVLCNSTNLKCGKYGTCVVELGVEKCLCDAGYGGIQCGDEENRCLTRGCHNGGNCSLDSYGVHMCECPNGYVSGLQCSIVYPALDLCVNQPCQNNGTCSYPVPIPIEGLPYICECTPG